jgi:hypothetical protein
MNGITSNPKTDTMARKHGIRHTTPGAIAGSVVLVCVFNYFNLMLPLTSLISLAGPFLLMTVYRVWVPIPALTMEKTLENTLKS